MSGDEGDLCGVSPRSFMTQNWDGHRIFPLKVVTLEVILRILLA
jgi:hypothetical protein